MTQRTEVETTERNKITPEVVTILRGLEDKKGRIDPRIVVAVAADPDSPVHGFFTWDDQQAIDICRMDEARNLIRRVKFAIVYEDVEYETVRYVADPDTKEASYVAQPKVRCKGQAAGVMAAELARILGNVDRGLGIARVHSFRLPPDIVEGLGTVRKKVAAMLVSCRG